MKIKLLISVLPLVLLANTGFCQTYRWEDKNGVNFTDNVESIPKKYRNKSIAEARDDITGERTPESGPDNAKEISKPSKKTRLNNDAIFNQQGQPQNSYKVDSETKYQSPRKHKRRHGNQTHGTKKSQQSVYDSQSPARKAMNKAEEMIRQDRQAIDSGGRLPLKKK